MTMVSKMVRIMRHESRVICLENLSRVLSKTWQSTSTPRSWNSHHNKSRHIFGSNLRVLRQPGLLVVAGGHGSEEAPIVDRHLQVREKKSSGAREKNLQVREKKNLQVREKKIFRWEEQPLVHNCGPRLPKWELGGRRGLCSRSKPPSEQIRQISTALFFIHLNAAVFSIAVLLRWPPTKSSGCSPISLFIPQDIRISLPGDATNSCEVAWCSHPWCGLAQKCCSHSSFFPLY